MVIKDNYYYLFEKVKLYVYIYFMLNENRFFFL